MRATVAPMVTTCKTLPNVIQLRRLNEAWPLGAKVPLMVAQANEANNATDETPAKAAHLRALRLAFCTRSPRR